MGWRGGGVVVHWLVLFPYCKTAPGLNLRLLCVEYACSPCACVGFLQVLRFPPTLQYMLIRSTAYTKLPMGVALVRLSVSLQ